MAAIKCSAVQAIGGHPLREHGGQPVSLANAVAHLNAVSAGVSVEPADYNWGTPSIMQQQALYTQFLQLAFMATLPQMQYTHLSACSAGMQAGRGAMFPAFMPPFPGFLSAVAAPCPGQSPSVAPCSVSAPAPQIAKPGAGHPENGVKVAKAGSPNRKAGAVSRAKTAKGSITFPTAPSGTTAGNVKVDPDIELEDICRLLGDDAFLEHLQDDVLSEGSNGSSSTSDGRVLSKNNSNDCLSGSLNNNDGGLFAGNNFASAFDIDMEDLPAPASTHEVVAASAAVVAAPKSGSQPPSKACSGDLNNLVSSSPTKSTRSSRVAAREAAAAAAKEVATVGGGAGAGSTIVTKVTLKTNRGGVQKTTGFKPSKGHAAVVADAANAETAAVSPSVVGVRTAVMPPEPGMALGADCPLTAADLSRLLGEDDNRIPEGWDLDLDFENPFSCSISAF